MNQSPLPPPSASDRVDDELSTSELPDADLASDDTASDQYSADDADVLFGVSFDGPLRAQEFLLTLQRLASDGHLVLRDAVLVVKDENDKVFVRETVDPQPGRSAMSGAMWSGLLGLLLGGPVGWIAGASIGAGAGALSAKVIDLGVPDEWVDWFKLAVKPQTATVVTLANSINFGALHREANRFSGAELVKTTLKPGAAAKLAEAFDPR